MKPDDRQALGRWEEYRKAIAAATAVHDLEGPEQREQRKAALRDDFVAFCRYYFPNYTTSPFGKFHLRQVEAVGANPRGVFCWVMARDHAKSIVHGVFVPLWLMVRGELRTMLLASWNEGNAIDLLQPLQAHLEANDRLIRDWGPFRNAVRWERGNFVTIGGVSFRAIGSGQSPRGARNDEARPDFILVDDFDEDEQSRNPKRVDEAHDWLMGALFPAMSVTGRGRFVVVGNVIAPDTVLTRVEKVADHTMRVNLLDARGLPTWKERFSLQDCQFMIERMGTRLAQREYFNNPITAGKVFKREWLQWAKLPPLREFRVLVGYLDPGFKKTKTADSKAWVLVGVHQGRIYIVRAFVAVASIKEMIGWGYELKALCDGQGAAVRLLMEEVFLQDLLYEEFARDAAERGAPLPLSGDRRKKPDKDARIEAMSGHFERGNVYFNEALKADHHMLRLHEQLLNFQPGANVHKDGPDALEGAIHALGTAAAEGAITVGARQRSKHRI
ncbi:MAG TPA: hypothetical protein PKE21_13790 [Flavobacteriales bacterium]|nr:hypothetical protein [Flavobacteriales bacterium]HMR28549.1 hypothetical protein [Flavobacteriales bacterium]